METKCSKPFLGKLVPSGNKQREFLPQRNMGHP